MQPAYLPWLGYFDRINCCDLFIYLDDVKIDQSSKTNFINRNKINSSSGPIWLTLPLKIKGNSDKKLNELELVKDNWKKKHNRSITFNYKKTPFFEDFNTELLSTFDFDWDFMVDIIYHINGKLLEKLNINTPILKSSEINVKGNKNDYILNLCKSQGATEYVSGIFGRDYLNNLAFQKQGIEILIHEYKTISYPQNFKLFTPYLSVIDLIFNHGEDALRIIKKGNNLVKI